MHIEVVAHTKISSNIEKYMKLDTTSTQADDLAEFAGRACYQSFNKPNPDTQNNNTYLKNILKQGHESVLEHASTSFYVQGVSRNMLLELERHRHLSFSVISTRFVDCSDMKTIVPPALRTSLTFDTLPLDPEIKEEYTNTVHRLMDKGHTRKEAREAARWVLPGSIETSFVVTGNHRAWRDVIKKRYSIHADREIRDFSEVILKHLRDLAPNTFQDIPETLFT